MKGVSFGDIHSYRDLNLILEPFTPTPAEPQTNFLQVPGRDGYLDLTEANGEVKFKSRVFSIPFTIAPGDNLTFDERVSMVSGALNGKQCNITFDRDPDYYWVGRLMVDKYARNKNIGQIIVKATVEPYKYRQYKSAASYNFATAINGDGSMIWADVVNLTVGNYWLLNPVNIPFASDYVVTFTGFLVVEYGAGSTERKFSCGNKEYTYDLYTDKLLKERNILKPGVSVILENGRKPVCPTITCENDSFTVAFNGKSYALQAGTQKVPEIRLLAGSNTLKVSGYGTITFRWQKGEL